MPQLDQFASTYASQIFWLLVVFGLIYFVIGRFMLPKIEGTMDLRDRRIADDLAAAEGARARADEIEQAYRARTDENRAEALKVTQAAKDSAARASEARIAEADAAAEARLSDAEARLSAAKQAAMAEVEGVASEAARDMVARLSGVVVDPAEADAAVRRALEEGRAHG